MLQLQCDGHGRCAVIEPSRGHHGVPPSWHRHALSQYPVLAVLAGLVPAIRSESLTRLVAETCQDMPDWADVGASETQTVRVKLRYTATRLLCYCPAVHAAEMTRVINSSLRSEDGSCGRHVPGRCESCRWEYPPGHRRRKRLAHARASSSIVRLEISYCPAQSNELDARFTPDDPARHRAPSRYASANPPTAGQPRTRRSLARCRVGCGRRPR
jgi:hypothetical protein